MSRRVRLAAAVGVTACSVAFVGDRGVAANPASTISGTGSAIIDGILAPGEWDRAATVDFSAPLPSAEGGGAVAARAYAMNDATNLYLAVRFAREAYGFGADVFSFFDRSNDTIHENGDDTVYAQVWRTMGLLFYDGYRWQCPNAPAGAPAYCGGAYDTVQVAGAPAPGTIDGRAAVREGTGGVVFELSHPLDSADDAHDFSLVPGSLIGFSLSTRFVAPCQTDAGCWADAAAFDGHIGISPGAELAVVARAAARRVRLGKTLRYTISVAASPAGAGAADASLQASIPRTIRITSARTTAGSCAAHDTLTCTFGTLAPGSRAVVTLRGRAVRRGDATVAAHAATSSYESPGSRDDAEAKATVLRR